MGIFSGDIMKRIRIEAICFLALGLLIAADTHIFAQQKPDLSGSWQLQLTPTGGAAGAGGGRGAGRGTGRSATQRPGMGPILRLEKSGDSFVGDINFMGQRVPIKDVQFKDGEISFRSVTK